MEAVAGADGGAAEGRAPRLRVAIPVAAAAGTRWPSRCSRWSAEKTGYPRDMLALDLDLEADLGIDTVKQAEVFGMVREAFDIPRHDNLKLREYPTLEHVIGFVRSDRPDSGRRGSAPRRRRLRAGPAGDALDAVGEKVLELVAEKTGYPRDMLALDLDLEADLGIDTVKQAEVFGDGARALQHSAPGQHQAARLPDA